ARSRRSRRQHPRGPPRRVGAGRDRDVLGGGELVPPRGAADRGGDRRPVHAPRAGHDQGRDVTAALDEPRVTGWLLEQIPEIEAPLTFRHIAGGRSNLTYRIDDATGRSWALRRPPTGGVLDTAHDM